MKNVFWNKIPASNVNKTVWKDVDEKDIVKELNTAEIEELFGKAGEAAATDKPGAAAADGKAKKVQTSIVDFNRANNIGIMLARVKMPHSDIK